MKGIITILVILMLLGMIGSCSGGSSSSNKYQDTVSCSYCGKVIRSGGVNIHGSSLFNGGVLKCDYCGHKTKIY